MKNYCTLLLILFPFFAAAQFTDFETLFERTGFKYAAIQQDDQKIEYLITKEKPSQKGIIFYSQGSLPVPIVLHLKNEFYTTIPIRYQNFYDDYRFVVISKPNIPVVADSVHLDQRNNYINDEGVTPIEYTNKLYLSYYTNTLDQVINHVLKQSNTTYEKVVVAGHSQGARVIVKAATINKQITHVAYLSGNPLGRIDESIRRERQAVLLGAKSEEEANESIQAIYEKWTTIHKDKLNLNSNKGDSNYTWSSFSENTIDDLLSIDVPIFVGYGTRDITARYCDLLPLDFISHQKTNLTHKPYLGYDHSFFKVELNGKVDYESGIFDQVVEDVLLWIEAN